MPGVSCLYRRSSGIYAVRIVVPARLRPSVGRGEIHVSTGLRDWNAAKLAALKIQFQWREKLMTLDVEKLATASPLLHGEGLISVCEAAKAIGLSDSSLLAELRNERAELFTQAQHWEGWFVADLDCIERDFDGAFVLNDVEQRGIQQVLSGVVRAFDPAVSIAALMTDGTATGSVFRVSGNGAFWLAHDVAIPLSGWMAGKSAIERIRSRLASAIPPELKKSASAPATAVSEGVVVMDTITAKYGHKRFSELFSLYRNHRKWGEDQSRRMATEAGLFVELMDDPPLSAIEVETIHEGYAFTRSITFGVGGGAFNKEFYDEGVSGATPAAERPGFADLLKFVREGDTVVVYAVDRLGRDAIDVQATVRALLNKGVSVEVHGLGVIGRGVGELILAVLAQVADMERQRIKERCDSGRAAARAALAATGKTHKGKGGLGRPFANDAEIVRAWKAENCASIALTAKHFNLSVSMIKRYCSLRGIAVGEAGTVIGV